MKKEALVFALSVSVLWSVSAFGSASMDKNLKNSETKSFIKKELSVQNKKIESASSDALKGLHKTFEAMRDLRANKADDASKLLAGATKDFDVALKNNPDLRLVPIGNDVYMYQFNGSVKDIQASLQIAKKMLQENHLQSVRELLAPLRDELDITTYYLPMDLYPDVTKIATKLLHKGKQKEALRELMMGLSMIEGRHTLMPLSLLDAQNSVLMASQLDKSHQKDALAWLDRATQSLQKTLLLGYTSKHAKEYQKLTIMIEDLKAGIKANNKVDKLYHDLKQYFNHVLMITRKESRKLDSDSVWNHTKVAHKNATKEEDKDIVNFAHKSETDAY
ncbi:YfdX family protein [Sulfurospirillum sp. 1612]|uniref:YfdX family protein n=1 Tax=Sulfurospirillum sp. 1612 TaxID=3094835 RepID=UPI002F927EA7